MLSTKVQVDSKRKNIGFSTISDVYISCVYLSTFIFSQLGFAGGKATSASVFGYVSSNFAMDDVSCKGDEEHLQDCSYETYEDCRVNEGAGVICHASEPTSITASSTSTSAIPPTSSTPEPTSTSYFNRVELLGNGNSTYEGNVYAVNHDEFFGPVCDDGWSDVEANVVCR